MKLSFARNKGATPPPWQHPEAAAWLAYADVRQDEGAGQSELERIRRLGLALMQPRKLVCVGRIRLPDGNGYQNTIIYPKQFPESCREKAWQISKPQHRRSGARLFDVRWLLYDTVMRGIQTMTFTIVASIPSWDAMRLGSLHVLSACMSSTGGATVTLECYDLIQDYTLTDFAWAFDRLGRPADWDIVGGWYRMQLNRQSKQKRSETERQAAEMSQVTW